MLKHKKLKYFIKFLWITTKFLQFVIHLFKHCDIYKSYRSLIQLLWNKVNTRDSKAIDNHPRCKNNGGTSLPFTCKTDLLIDFILLNGSFFQTWNHEWPVFTFLSFFISAIWMFYFFGLLFFKTCNDFELRL